MAVIHTGSIVNDIRGSVGAETYSRNQGGAYVRTRAGPGDPPTQNQIDITDAMTALAQSWSATLTATQRDSWHQYADQFPRPNQWGSRSLSNGYTRYIAVNFLEQVRVSSPLRSSAPTAPPLPMPLFTIALDAQAQWFQVHLPLSIELPDDSTFRAYVFAGDEISQGVSFYRHPFQYSATNTKVNGVWQTDPWKPAKSFSFGEDIKMFARLRIQDTITGAISPATYASAIVTTTPPP